MMRKRLGELLIDAGLIDEYQLQSALGHQRQWGGRLGQILVHMNLVVEDKMVRVLSMQLAVAIAEPPPDDLHVRVLGEVSVELAVQHHVFPLAIRRDPKGDQLVLAMTDPTNVAAIDAIQFTSGKKIVPLLAGGTSIETWIRRHYQGERVVQPSGSADTTSESSAQMSVQFAGQLIDLGGASDDDDIPVVTGAMVAAPAPPALAEIVDPFATLAQTTVPIAAPTPSARFGAAPVAVAGTVTTAFAGTGLATLDPLSASSRDNDAWTQNVELPPPPPTPAPSATAPSFGPSGGFLGADDDEVAAAPVAPGFGADPFASLAPSLPAADPFTALPQLHEEPVMDLEELILTDTAPAVVVEAPVVVEAAPVIVEAAPVVVVDAVLVVVDAAPVVFVEAAPVVVVEAAPTPSWGDLLDAPTTAPRPHHDSLEIEIAVAASDIELDVPAFESPVVEPDVQTATTAAPVAEIEPGPFSRVVTAEAFPNLVPPPLDVVGPPGGYVDLGAAAASLESPVGLTATDDAAQCPRCNNGRVESARFCPFCGLSYVGVPLASGAVPVQSEFTGPADLDIDLNEPSGPQPVAPRQMAADDIGAAPLEAAVEAPIEPAVDDIGLVAANAPIELAVDDVGLSAVEVPIDLAVDDVGLAAVEAPIDLAVDDVGLAAVEAPIDLADDDVGLAAVEAPLELAADVAPAFAAEWADAAEKQIPRKETDTRNDLGWVPPSREIVVVAEPAAPPPEPIAAYTPAAPPGAIAAAAPWALFTPSMSPVEVRPVEAEAVELAPNADETWVVPAADHAVEAAVVVEAPALFDAAIVDIQSLDLDVSDVSEIEISDVVDPSDLSREPLEMIDDVVEMSDEVDEPVAERTTAATPVVAAEPPPSTLVGWGDLIDTLAPTDFPPPVLPSISVASFMPPATLTPPPMALHRPPTLDAPMAPPALSAPLVPPPTSWPTVSHDDPFAAALAPVGLDLTSELVVAAVKPQRVTATMVMKLDPAEQKRLLAMLLANTEITSDALATPPRSTDDPEKT